MTPTATTTCERQVCALTATNERVMRPCIREAGHEGVCRYSPRPWWATADNPPCRSWCTAVHPGNEFTRGGSLLCSKVIAMTDSYTVEVTQVTTVRLDNALDVYELLEPAIYETAGDVTDWPLEETEQYGQALVEAVAFARSVANL